MEHSRLVQKRLKRPSWAHPLPSLSNDGTTVKSAFGGYCVCVVGSGLTGTIAALTLLEDGVPVVMLESGCTFPRRFHARFRDVDLIRPNPPTVQAALSGVDFVAGGDGSAKWIRAHRLGGLSNYWTGIALRFSPDDFTDGERLHHKYRWPLSYRELEAYYARVEALIRIRGGQQSFEALPASKVVRRRSIGLEWSRVAELCRERGRDLAALSDVQGPATTMSALGAPYNAAVRLLRGLRRMRGFRLIARAHVTRVLSEERRPVAGGVEYIDKRTGTYHKLAAKAVVLAAGPLASTHILLNSKSVSHPEGLGNSHGLVGRFLHDHPLEYIELNGDFCFRALDNRRRGGLYITREGYSGSPPLEATALLLYGGMFFRLAPWLLLHGRRHFKTARRILANLSSRGNESVFPLHASILNVCCFGTQVPRYENGVALDDSRKDAYGVPLLRIDAAYSADELDNMKRGRQVVPEIMEAAGCRIFHVSSELQPYGSSVHYGGTNRMHESPDWGVLDGWNRLHDAKNVLVVDASCFTTCPEKNPSLTAMAIAMRAASNVRAACLV
jgi:choline dehydrogenase-like flavoprotein